MDDSRDLYERVFPVNSAVTGGFGISGLKYVCDRLGFAGGFVRKPLLQLKDDEKARLDEILEIAGII